MADQVGHRRVRRRERGPQVGHRLVDLGHDVVADQLALAVDAVLPADEDLGGAGGDDGDVAEGRALHQTLRTEKLDRCRHASHASAEPCQFLTGFRRNLGTCRRPSDGWRSSRSCRPGRASPPPTWPSASRCRSAPRAATSSTCAGSGTGSRARPGGTAATPLAGGTKLPPLLLDADEAAAVALGLTGDLGVSGLELAAGTALAKVTESAPSRARGTLTAVGTTVQSDLDRRHHGSSRVLLALAHACRQGTSVHLRKRDGGGEHRRHVQPHRLVKVGARWYLVAYVAGRDEWSVYAVARIIRVDPVGRRLPAPPAPDRRGEPTSGPSWPPGRAGTRFGSGCTPRPRWPASWSPPPPGRSSTRGRPACCSLDTDDLDWAARYLVYLNVDFDVLAPAELSTALHTLGDWLSRRHRRELEGQLDLDQLGVALHRPAATGGAEAVAGVAAVRRLVAGRHAQHQPAGPALAGPPPPPRRAAARRSPDRGSRASTYIATMSTVRPSAGRPAAVPTSRGRARKPGTTAGC